ncbi:ITS3 [Enterospora canceri]|uniref:ITS3 n=1 Tax=Enterospora canceri TaxID=1081671 RepID=A0A1Y1S6A5_9MICR|nr:ITS3 [Enterospora canceri]
MELSSIKIDRIRDAIRTVRYFTDYDDDIECNQIDSELIDQTDQVVFDESFIGEMHCGGILGTKQVVQITSDEFVFNQHVRGKSNSLVFYTGDFKYCIKEIRKGEFDYLVENISHFVEHCRGNTFIARYHGIFTVEYFTGHKHHYVVMQNVLDRKYSRIYDLKGTNLRRNEISAIRHNLDGSIGLSPSSISQLNSDIDFLTRIGLMDYSIVVGVSSDGSKCAIGIVDTLTEYRIGKKVERMYSLVFYGDTRTAANPEKYGERIKRMVKERFNRCGGN